ncbi:MAG: MmcQ/YjbR family DNA-binding protein [Longimicrobiales bacterium]
MVYHQRISRPDSLKAVARVRALATEFPEVDEKVDGFGHTSFRVKDKPFIMMGEDADCWLSFKADRYTQDFLLKRDCFEKTPYIGQHGWTSIKTHEVADWDEIADLITQAYVRVAPARLGRLIEGEN